MAARFVLPSVILLRGPTAHAAAVDESSPWIEQLLTVPYAVPASAQPVKQPIVQLVRQNYEQLEINRSVIKTPIAIGWRRFDRGVGTHSIERIVIRSPEALARFSAWIGVDNSARTRGRQGSVTFAIAAERRPLTAQRSCAAGMSRSRWTSTSAAQTW